MSWGNFLLSLAIFYPVYYGINILIDITRSPKKAENDYETFTFEDSDEETFLLDDEEDFEVSPSSQVSSKPLFEPALQPSEQTAKSEATPSEIIDQPIRNFINVQDQGIPVLEFRSKAKELASSFKF